MMKRLIGFLSCISILLTFLGCERTECTPRQHYEIMQEIRPFKDDIVLYNPPPLSKLIYDVDKVLRIGISKKTYRKDVISKVRFLCNYHGTSFGAFNHAHEQLGILKLPYTDELKIYVNEQWKKPHYGRWFVQDKEGRIITCEDLEYDLGFLSGPDHSIVVLDENGNKNIYGYTLEDVEFNTLLKNKYNPDTIWHIKTHRDVKTKDVFGLIDRILLVVGENDNEEVESVYVKFTFSEISDSCFKNKKVIVSSDFCNPDAKIPDSVEFVIYLMESGEIILNGKDQFSIKEMAAILNQDQQTCYHIKHIVVNEEVSWTNALEFIFELNSSISLHRVSQLEELEKVRVIR